MAMKSCRSLLNFSTRQHSHSTSLSLLRYTQTRSIVTSSNSFVLSSNHLTRPLSNNRHQFKRNYGVEEFFDQTKDELGRTRQIGRLFFVFTTISKKKKKILFVIFLFFNLLLNSNNFK